MDKPGARTRDKAEATTRGARTRDKADARTRDKAEARTRGARTRDKQIFT